jgi:hypothetical protein
VEEAERHSVLCGGGDLCSLIHLSVLLACTDN